MLKELNQEVLPESIDLFIEELDNREEMKVTCINHSSVISK